MAARLAPGWVTAEHHSLLHFVGQSPWPSQGMLAPIRASVLPALTGRGPVEACDDRRCAQIRSGRQLSAWLGLVSRQRASGGKDRLWRMSKRGDGTIRSLLVQAVRTVLRWRRAKPGTEPGWTGRLLTRRPTNVVLVAMANKTARVAWARLSYERIYQPTHA